MADEVMHGRFGLRWSRWLADRDGADYATAYARAHAALPLVRLGVDETGDKRVVNVAAKRLVGFSEEDIERSSGRASPPRAAAGRAARARRAR